MNNKERRCDKSVSVLIELVLDDVLVFDIIIVMIILV